MDNRFMSRSSVFCLKSDDGKSHTIFQSSTNEITTIKDKTY